MMPPPSSDSTALAQHPGGLLAIQADGGLSAKGPLACNGLKTHDELVWAEATGKQTCPGLGF